MSEFGHLRPKRSINAGRHRHERSRPQYRSDAGEPALRRKSPFRRRVPLAGDARQKALPHARRCAGIRRAEGKPKRAQARPVHQGCDRRAKAGSDLVGRSMEIARTDEMICGTVFDLECPNLNPGVSLAPNKVVRIVTHQCVGEIVALTDALAPAEHPGHKKRAAIADGPCNTVQNR
jgi:hypothetical protein